MRNIPAIDLGKILKAQAGNWAAFIMIELEQAGKTTLRYCSSWEPITHLGNEYQPRWFEIALPDSSRDSQSADGQLVLDDSDLEPFYWAADLDRTKYTKLTLFVVSTTDLNTKLIAPYSYRVVEMMPANQNMLISVIHADSLREPVCFVRYDDHYPALHSVVSE